MQKYVYDGAGRETTAYTTDGGGDTSWSDAWNVTGDVVLSQVETQYDGDGNPIFSTDRERFHDDSGTATGGLGSPSSGIGARVYYTGDYYDAAERLTDSVNFGTNSGTTLSSRPAIGSLPSGSLHTTYQYLYSTSGHEDIVTDPRGIQTETFYDLLGRTTETVDGHTSGSPTSIDQATYYTYDGDNHILTQKAIVGSGHQTTQYGYGYTGTGGYTLNSNDILVKLQLPDPTTGDPSGSNSNDQSYTYDDLGEKMKTVFDENGAIRAFTYDVVGRVTSDGFALTGSGEDATVRSLGYTYDTNGQLSTASSYSGYLNTGTLLNQVQEDYNGLGQLIGEYQSHSGAVNTSTTLEVKYLYAGLTGSTSDGRATGMIYPTTSTDTTPRQLNYVYNTGLDSNISRISALADQSGDGAGNVESYSYLGLSTIVQRNRPNGVNLTYAKLSGESNGSAGDEYTGLDEFGRVIDQRWTTSGGTNVERYQYAYDADSNLLYKYNLSTGTNAANFSELYHTNTSGSGYDALNRLTDFQRGELDPVGQTMTVTGTAGISQDWTLDAVGNWTSFSTNGTPQSRTANQRNEYTTVGSNTPTYDNNGNLTKDETGQQYVYDAWNRLKQVKNSGGAVLVTYSYDALGRGVVETPGTGTATDVYFDRTNVIEERQGGATTTQYVWGIGYVNDLIERDRNADGNTATGSYGKSGSGLEERLFVQQDSNFNVTAIVDASGNVVERFAYDPYGARQVLDANWNPISESKAWIYSFQGGRQDPISGLIHFGRRDYSTSLGRWTASDPDLYVDGPNVYQMLGGNPVVRLDPTGTQYNPFAGLDEFTANNPGWSHGVNPGNAEEVWRRNMAELARERDEALAAAQRLAEDLARAALLGRYDPCPNAAAHRAARLLTSLNPFTSVPSGIRDLMHDVQNWEWSWSHLKDTAEDALAGLPVVGGAGAEGEEADAALNEAESAAEGEASSYDDLVQQAREAYPNKAGAVEQHHITPQYLGGPAGGPTVSVDAAYHQQITNAFRNEWPYGTGRMPSPEQLQTIMNKVYSQYPLPPGTQY